jgi:hypothetical protein
MNVRFISGALAVLAVTSTAAVTAQQRNAARADVTEAGGVFHAPVCPKTNKPDSPRCFARVVTDRAGVALINRFRGGVKTRSASALPLGYSPSDLRAAYKITSPGSSNQTIAIVDAYGYPNAEADLATYRAQYGLPPCTTGSGCFRKLDQYITHVTGGSQVFPAFNLGWAQETALDLQMASAACPQCKIMLVQANAATWSNLTAAVDKAAAFGATAISNSYGGSEAGGASWASHYNHPGIAVTASTGDTGYAAGPKFPATSPNVIAVGGTKLVPATNPRGWSESAWTLGGSGCSGVFARPIWQTPAIAPITLCVKRSEADIAAVADPATGVAVYAPTSSSTAAWMVIGGTSAGAPFIAGLFGVHKAVYGDGIYDAASIYQVSGAGLFDVTAGNNGSCGGNGICTAGVGYDGPTGRGSPNGVSRFGQCTPPSGGIPTC